MGKLLAVSFVLFFTIQTSFRVLAQEVVDVPARGTITRILIESPETPKAMVALFTGGKGVVKIKADGKLKKARGNFAVRTRFELQKLGLATAVVDAPADMLDDLRPHRGSKEYAESMRAVIGYLKTRFKIPVWLHGTSRGTNSVTAIASDLSGTPERPDGIVVSATVFRGYKFHNVFNYYLEKIGGPVLILHHKDDACRVTPPDDVEKFIKELRQASLVKSIFYEGGSPKGDECQARHYHGFNGIEKKVMADLANFILRH